MPESRYARFLSANRLERGVLLVRHGRPLGTEHRYYGKWDVPLSDEGRAQAKRLHRALAGVPIGAVHVSPLARSRETAEIIVPGFAPLRAEPALAEIDLGDWEGRPTGEIKRLFPEDHERRGRDLAGFRPPGGESFGDLAARAWPAFERILAGLEGIALVVGHAGVNRVIMARILAQPLDNIFRLRQDYGCLNIIEPWPRSPVVRAVNLIPAIDDTLTVP